MSRPGTMLYFDDWNTAAKRLDMEQRGTLVSALMAFSQTGEVPEIENPLTAFAFDIFADKATRDEEKYRQKCTKNAYNVYLRDCKENPLSFEEWNARYRSITNGIQLEQEQELESEQETELESETESERERESGNGIGAGAGNGAVKGFGGTEGENQLSPEDEAAVKRLLELERKRSGRA